MIPEVYPISARHIGFDFIRSSSAFFFECLELFRALAFGLGKYIFRFRQAFIVITNYDSSFPSAVFAKA